MINSKSILCSALAVSLAVATSSFGLVGCSSEKAGDNKPDNFWAIENNSGEDPYAEEKAVTAQMKSDGMVNAEADVAPIVEEYGDHVGFLVSTIEDSDGFAINGDKQFVAGSDIKLLIAAEFIRQVDEEIIRLQDVYIWNKEDMVGGTGTMRTEPEGTTYSYDSLFSHMIKYNDNSAANILIDILGMDNINAEAQALGLTQTVLNHKMMAKNPKEENYTCANDLAILLHGFADDTIGTSNLCLRVVENMRGQTTDSGCGAGLPKIYYGHIPSFSGDASNDAGVVYARYPYIIVVLTDLPEKKAKALMKKVTSTVNDDMKGYLRPLQ